MPGLGRQIILIIYVSHLFQRIGKYIAPKPKNTPGASRYNTFILTLAPGTDGLGRYLSHKLSLNSVSLGTPNTPACQTENTQNN